MVSGPRDKEGIILPTVVWEPEFFGGLTYGAMSEGGAPS